VSSNADLPLRFVLLAFVAAFTRTKRPTFGPVTQMSTRQNGVNVPRCHLSLPSVNIKVPGVVKKQKTESSASVRSHCNAQSVEQLRAFNSMNSEDISEVVITSGCARARDPLSAATVPSQHSAPRAAFRPACCCPARFPGRSCRHHQHRHRHSHALPQPLSCRPHPPRPAASYGGTTTLKEAGGGWWWGAVWGCMC